MSDDSSGTAIVGILGDGRIELNVDGPVWLSPDDARQYAAEVCRLADIADDVFAP